MQEAVKGTVWMTGGCTSWYIDKTGIPNLYPWEPTRYLKAMRHPDFSEYREQTEVESEESLAAA